ncbi:MULTISPECIES: helix-turn-helix transcriptional regulator [Maribacter]|uniref:Helix-turn-helix transcriptional regulator n=1 Tax=Maribacter flavus TaxID=1658664 RepID=A0ABU7IHQ1_9FLAO|nr:MULTISPECIES: helix-turn-helix transcriptional regulator [Maribacter]MDC6405059.1 helix-turn-helix transcriptional regulator [Maribacter sp. PR66]MEE1972473.1 helix-turn-helix transcriptional regulator [Maribacter flavus]
MIASFKPHLNLKDVIREYYLSSFYAFGETKLIPIVDDCCHDIIYYKQAKAKLIYGDKQTVDNIECHLFTILGLTPPYVLKYKDELNFFTIKFQPWMNNFFFGHLKQSGIVNLEDRFSELNPVLNEIEQKDKIENSLKAVNRYFTNLDVALSPKVETVKSICEFIYNNNGIVKVNDISTHFKKTRQYINKIFKEEVMCSLKTFITSVKILSLVKQKSKSEEQSLTELAYEYGYFDQAHFINDFKKVCGITPSYYFENLPEFILRHH